MSLKQERKRRFSIVLGLAFFAVLGASALAPAAAAQPRSVGYAIDLNGDKDCDDTVNGVPETFVVAGSTPPCIIFADP